MSKLKLASHISENTVGERLPTRLPFMVIFYLY